MQRLSWPLVPMLAMLAAFPAQALPSAHLSPAQQAAIFPEQRSLVLKDLQDRLSFLRDSQACVSSAHTSQAMFACLLKEHQHTLQLAQQNHQQMLAILKRHGVQVVDQAAPQPPAGAAG